jgi:hypothetical protein
MFKIWFARVAAGLVIATVTTLGGVVATAGAVTLPPHNVPYPTWCINDSTSGLFGLAAGQAAINSGYPTADAMPGAGTTPISVDDSAQSGVSSGDEWIYFRIWAGWWDGYRWQYRAGNWMARSSGFLDWWVQANDGSWYMPTAGLDVVAHSGDGDVAESRVIVAAGRSYHVAYQYYWGAIANTAFSGATDFRWYSQVSC